MRKFALFVFAFSLVQPSAHAAPLEGFGIGGGLASTNLEAESDFTGTPPSADGEATGSGLFLKGDYMGRNGNFGYRFSLLVQGVNAEADLFADDSYEVENLGTVGADLGYASPPHFFFGVVELGAANVAHIDDNYGRTEESVGVFGLGLGYTYAASENIELTAELFGRALGQLELNYIGGPLAGESQTIDATTGSLLFGASYRF